MPEDDGAIQGLVCGSHPRARTGTRLRAGEILRRRFGGPTSESYRQLAVSYGVSHERIRQVIQESLADLARAGYRPAEGRLRDAITQAAHRYGTGPRDDAA